jgi:HSP20 family protein
MQTVELKSSPSEPGRHVFYEVTHNSSEDARVRLRWRSNAWRPPTDVFDTEDTIVVQVEVAGMVESDFSIMLDGRYLYIRGVRIDTAEKRAYHQMEVPFGEFVTEVELPHPVEPNNIEAFYKNGFLKVILPFARPHKIQVED